ASVNALAIARHFEGHPKIERVLYPGLMSHAGHGIAKRQMTDGFGGMLSLLVKGGAEEARKVCTRLKVIIAATSLGGVESLAEHRSEAEVLDAYSATVIGAVERAGPAVVHIAVAASQGRGGTGSGFIVSADGLILTNSHVVSGARSIAVSTSDGQRAQARIIGEDPDTDIAVIRSDANLAVPALALSDSKSVKVGQLAVAIGNPLGFEQTVTTGV